MPRSSIVITGVGVVSPNGIGRSAFWDALVEGRSGIRSAPIDCFGTLPIHSAGTVEGFDAGDFIKPRKAIKLMCRESQMAYVAAILATRDANLESGSFAPERLGVVFGSQMFYGPADELTGVFRSSREGNAFSIPAWGRSFSRDMFPLWLLNYLPNMPACHIAIALQALGPNNTIVQGDASGLLALAEAFSVIERGWADVMLVGSVGSQLSVTRQVHVSREFVSRSRDPGSASRPFDAACDGMVLAEGAAAVVLELRSHAEARGVRPLVECAGFGRQCQAAEQHYHGATSTAIEATLRSALRAARMSPTEIGHVNANGTGIRTLDRTEARAIQTVFGDTPVTAPKSYFGHAASGAGVLELSASVLGMAAGQIPGTLNYQATDPDFPIHVLHGEPMPSGDKSAIVLNQSTTGQVAAVVLRPGG